MIFFKNNKSNASLFYTCTLSYTVMCGYHGTLIGTLQSTILDKNVQSESTDYFQYKFVNHKKNR